MAEIIVKIVSSIDTMSFDNLLSANENSSVSLSSSTKYSVKSNENFSVKVKFENDLICFGGMFFLGDNVTVIFSMKTFVLSPVSINNDFSPGKLFSLHVLLYHSTFSLVPSSIMDDAKFFSGKNVAVRLFCSDTKKSDVMLKR